MKKTNQQWTIERLVETFENLEFPEFQREPTVWGLDKKKKLIDSIFRNFDIATIYLYGRDDGNYECIDGRQRINAIYSFLGLNEELSRGTEEDAYHNRFIFSSSDELLGSNELSSYDKKRWDELDDVQKSRILNYPINVIVITDIGKEEELNLMFLRLQLGSALSAGEKLKAMLGEMRNLIFGTGKKTDALGKHPYFEYLGIPKRRFSRELTASQVAINFYSLRMTQTFSRARFVDLQKFYRDHVSFSKADVEIAALLRTRLEEAHANLPKKEKLVLRNRAIGVSCFLFLNDLIDKKQTKRIPEFIEFLRIFLSRLHEQIKKGPAIEERYRDLLTFQTYVSQAAVESYAIENRQKLLEKYFEYYLKKNKIIGDN
jgi:hypothetical protein